MASLEYSSDIAGRQVHTYARVYNCNRCLYFTKSIFFMRNHARHHRLPPQIFDCGKNDIEVFYCKECQFATYRTNDFNRHIRGHHLANHKTAEVKPTKSVLRSYKCERCIFETFSVLMWLKHDTNCKLKNKVEKKRKYKSERNEGEDTNPLPKKKRKLAKRHECDQCTYAATRLDQLKKHKLIHLPWLKCDKCRYKTKAANNLRLHCKVHVKLPRLFQCLHCDLKTKSQHLLDTHILYRHEQDDSDKWLQCDQCTFKTLYSGSLKKHSLKHGTIKKQLLKCPLCDLETERQDLLDVHILYLHHQVPAKWDNNREDGFVAKQPEPATKWFKCPHCYFKSHRQQLLNTHLLSRHKKVLTRSQIKKVLTKSQIKKKVKKTENKQVSKKRTTIKCKECNFRTSSNQALKKHMVKAHATVPVVPTVKKVPVVPTVKKVTKKRTPKSVKRKLKPSEDVQSKNSAVKPTYKCDQCNEAFRKKVDLRIHKKMTHPSLHPLRCDVCLKQFSHRGSLLRHLKEQHITEHEMEWFSCSKCLYKGKREEQLLNHQKCYKH